MSVETGLYVVGFGAGALDVYRQPGDVGDDFMPGAKIGWTEADDIALQQLLGIAKPHDEAYIELVRQLDPLEAARLEQENKIELAERHVGGNAMNTLAYLALKSELDARVALVSVLGHGDMSSESIRTHLRFIGVEDRSLTIPGYLPSVSIIERDGDRMVRGRPRHPLGAHLSDEYIAAQTANANVVLAASLKDPELAKRIFRTLPLDTILSYNPGSSEFRDYPGLLQEAMRMRNPNLLALNDEELAQLMRAPDGANLQKLAEDATEFSETVLFTGGAKFIAMVRRLRLGRVEHSYHPVEALPGGLVKDTLGAGDRAHGVALHGIIEGKTSGAILRNVAESTRTLIQHTGAHGDLYVPEDFVKVQEPNLRRPLAIASR